jgi:hypothetical protein
VCATDEIEQARTHVKGRGGRGVDPGLVADAVREPAVGAADGDVHHQVEGYGERAGGQRLRARLRRRQSRKGRTPVKGRRVVVALEPGVLERDLLGRVLDDGREVAAVPEALALVLDVEHLVDARVDVWQGRVEGRGQQSCARVRTGR